MSTTTTDKIPSSTTSTISSSDTSNSQSQPKDLSLVSTVAKFTANIIFTLIAVTPMLLPIVAIGGKESRKKLTKRLNK